jgi:hypothetical protein
MIKTQYIKDSFSMEMKSFIPAVQSFKKEKKDIDESIRFLQKGYQTAKVQKLTDQEWSKMENTESWMITSVDKMIPAAKKIKSSVVNREAIGEIFIEYATQKVRAPIAIRLANKKLYLVAGDDRLMAARVLGFSPNIVVINTPW